MTILNKRAVALNEVQECIDSLNVALIKTKNDIGKMQHAMLELEHCVVIISTLPEGD